MNILDKFSLAGKTALVTGCKRGIGKAMAIALAEAGADIIGVSASLELEGSTIEGEVKARGRNFKAYLCDFSLRDKLYEFISAVKADFSVIDILVINSGTILRTPAAEHPDEMYDKVVEVNQNAQFILTREIGKEMVARCYGKIVFTAFPNSSKALWVGCCGPDERLNRLRIISASAVPRRRAVAYLIFWSYC